MKLTWLRCGLSIVSAIVGLAVLALWVRSYFLFDEWVWHKVFFPRDTVIVQQLHVGSKRGALCLENERDKSGDIDWIETEKTDRGGFNHTAYHGAQGFWWKDYGFHYDSWQKNSGEFEITSHAVYVPMWALALGCGVMPVVEFRRRRWTRQRRAGGLCAQCGYDLRAHAAGEKCPECGTPK